MFIRNYLLVEKTRKGGNIYMIPPGRRFETAIGGFEDILIANGTGSCAETTTRGEVHAINGGHIIVMPGTVGYVHGNGSTGETTVWCLPHKNQCKRPPELVVKGGGSQYQKLEVDGGWVVHYPPEK